jgi:predicted membrane metal-binding protein
MRWAFVLSQGASTPLSRNAPVFFLPLLPALCFALLAVRWKNEQAQLARFFFGLALTCVLCTFAARRALPPARDIAFLVRQIDAPQGAIEKPAITLRGYVADFPTRGEFNTQFPLQCVEADWNGRKLVSGRVWLSVPRAAQVEVGDAIQVEAQLADLPRPGNFGEREDWMRFIDNRCWCIGKVRAASGVRKLRAPPHFVFSRLVASARAKLLNHYQSAFSQPDRPYQRATSQLLTAMAFGQGGLVEPLPKTLRDDFHAAGMSHILVASGTQVSFIVLIILGGARIFGLRRWLLLLALLPVLIGYAFLAGGQSSIWRASMAGICIAVALLHGREVDTLSTV